LVPFVVDADVESQLPFCPESEKALLEIKNKALKSMAD